MAPLVEETAHDAKMQALNFGEGMEKWNHFELGSPEIARLSIELAALFVKEDRPKTDEPAGKKFRWKSWLRDEADKPSRESIERKFVEFSDSIISSEPDRGDTNHPAKSTDGPSRIAKESLKEIRNRYIYNRCNEGIEFIKISRELTTHNEWDQIETPQGIKSAANSFARRHELPKIAKRQAGRKKPDGS